MKTKPGSSNAQTVSRVPGNETAEPKASLATTTPWRPPTRRWFLGAVAVAAAAVVVVKPKPVEALPTRWIGHC